MWPNPLCPGCLLEMRYSWRCDQWECSVCEGAVTAEERVNDYRPAWLRWLLAA